MGFRMTFSGTALRGYGLALSATVLWSTVFPLVRVLPVTLSPVELAFWRWLFTFLCMLPFGFSSVKRHWPILKRQWKWMVLASVPGFGAYSVLMFEAGRTTDATNMALIAATAPVFMAVFARFFLHERLAPVQITGLVLAVAGVVVLVSNGDVERLAGLSLTAGDGWMLLAASFFAVYSILIRRRPAGLPQKASMTAMLFYTLFALSPFMAFDVIRPDYRLPDTSTFLIMLYIAILPTLIGYLLWNRAVDAIGAARAGMVYYSIPLFSSLEAVLFLHETVSLSQLTGGLLIVGGILLSSVSALRLFRRP